jgi:hypothetical protein
MKTNKQTIKRVFTLSSLLVVAVLLLTACGAFSFQGQAQPNAEGGVDISGGVQQVATTQPDTNTQPTSGTGLNQTTIILLAVGFGVLILILLILIGRGHGSKTDGPPS